MNATHCECLERIGDNGDCPVHGQYAPGQASLFAAAAREPNTVYFTCQSDFRVGNCQLEGGMRLKAVYQGDGLWSLSGYWKTAPEIARLNAHDVNKLAGYQMVQEVSLK